MINDIRKSIQSALIDIERRQKELTDAARGLRRALKTLEPIHPRRPGRRKAKKKVSAHKKYWTKARRKEQSDRMKKVARRAKRSK